MKTKLLFFLFSVTLFFSTFSYSQPMREAWARTAGGTGVDAGRSIAVDHHGGVYIGGYFFSSNFTIGNVTLVNTNPTGTDAFIAKYDTTGNFIWAKGFGGTGNQSILALAVSAAGNIYAAGTGFKLARLDNNGNIIWQVPGPAGIDTLPGGAVAPFSIVLDSRENVYYGFPEYFEKYNADGAFRFSRSIPLSTNDRGGLSVDKFDNVHLAFYAQSNTSWNTGPPSNQNLIFSLSTRVWFDSLGVYMGRNQLSPVVRERIHSYKAKSPSEYFYAIRFSNLSSVFTEYWRGSLIAGGGAGGCYGGGPIYTEFDNIGNAFYSAGFSSSFGNMSCGFPYTLGPIDTATGGDIYLTRLYNATSEIQATSNNGRTNEGSTGIVADTISRALYILGVWWKFANEDTARFRFGNSVLNTSNNVNSEEILLLKYNYPSTPLTVNCGSDKSVCANGSATMNAVVSGGLPPYSYSWTPATGVSNPAISNPVIQPPPTGGEYVLTVTDALGAIDSDTIRVLIDSNLYRPVIEYFQTNPFCEGYPLLMFTGPGTSYSWSTGGTGMMESVSQTDTITVTVTHANGCIGTSPPFYAIMLPRTPVPTVTPPDPVGLCAGVSSITLTAHHTQNPVTFNWLSPFFTNTNSVQVNAPGDYQVSATGPNGCPSFTVTKSVTQLQGPQPTISQNNNLLSVTPAAASYQWFQDGVAINGATGQSLTITQGGNYSVLITASNGCTGSAATTAILRTVVPGFSYQTYPNPVTGDLNIVYTISQADQVRIVLNDMMGQQIYLLVNRAQQAGEYSLTIVNASSRLQKGYYFLEINIGNKKAIRKILVM